MPKLKKLLSRFNKRERKAIEILLEKIVSFDWHGLDVKKLKGYQDVFRVRKGNIRVIFVQDEKDILILAIEHRREDTYKF